jgi:hypothetical protein
LVSFTTDAHSVLPKALVLGHNIIKIIKSRHMRLAGHMACMGEKRNTYIHNSCGNLIERSHLKDTGKDGRIILK